MNGTTIINGGGASSNSVYIQQPANTSIRGTTVISAAGGTGSTYIYQPTNTSQYIANGVSPANIYASDDEYEKLSATKAGLLAELNKVTREKDSINTMNNVLIQKLMSFGC